MAESSQMSPITACPFKTTCHPLIKALELLNLFIFTLWYQQTSFLILAPSPPPLWRSHFLSQSHDLSPDHHSLICICSSGAKWAEGKLGFRVCDTRVNMGPCERAWSVLAAAHNFQGPFEGWELVLTGLKVRLGWGADKMCVRDRTCTSEHPLL